jgi:hypothetical protein
MIFPVFFLAIGCSLFYYGHENDEIPSLFIGSYLIINPGFGLSLLIASTYCIYVIFKLFVLRYR